MLRYILAIIVLLICVGLFVFSYYLNHKTAKPENCQDLENECEACQMTSCLKNTKKEG